MGDKNNKYISIEEQLDNIIIKKLKEEGLTDNFKETYSHLLHLYEKTYDIRKESIEEAPISDDLKRKKLAQLNSELAFYNSILDGRAVKLIDFIDENTEKFKDNLAALLPEEAKAGREEKFREVKKYIDTLHILASRILEPNSTNQKHQ